MAGKFKLMFGDFFRTARKLWLEMMGALFFALAIMFGLNALQEYRRAAGHFTTWDWKTSFTVFGTTFFAVLLLAFSIQSFWKARKMR
jgi:hypothetical protein